MNDASTVRIVGAGSEVDVVIANLREKLDEQLGEGEWTLCDCGNCNPVWIDMKLSAGGTSVAVEVALIVKGDRLSTRALPREATA